MSTNKHPHIEVITAWYNGAAVDYRKGDEREWVRLDDHVPGCIAPKFDPRYQYRVAPKTRTVELTEDEIETLFLVTCYVGGSPGHSPRRHMDSAQVALGKVIGARRCNALTDWTDADPVKVTGSVMFREHQLPPR